MIDLAKVLLIGRLTKDPEIRYTPKGLAVATMRLAVNPRGRDKREEVSFFDVVTFGQLAETCAEYLAKGRTVLVDGRLRQQSWESEDGTRRSKLEVVAASVEFLDAPPDAGKRAEEKREPPPEEAKGELPPEDEEPPF